MMAADDLRTLSTIGAALWAAGSLGVLLIQIFVWPKDTQQWAALLAVATVFVLTARLFVALAFGIAMGSTEQGVFVFFGGGLLWMGFLFHSWQRNLGSYGSRWREIRARFRK